MTIFWDDYIDRPFYHRVEELVKPVEMIGRMARVETAPMPLPLDRLDWVIVWEHVSYFSERERAALAWTEALTVLDRRTDYAALRARLWEHFSEQEIGVLTSVVAMINLWNRIQVSRH